MNNQLYFFWKVGRFVFEKRLSCENIVLRSSTFLSYYYGNSCTFSFENIIFMRKFYLCFPIYNNKMNELDWDSYVQLMKIKDKKILNFYYYLALFCKYNCQQLEKVIESDVYFRI